MTGPTEARQPLPASRSVVNRTILVLFILCGLLLAGLGTQLAKAQEFNLRLLTHNAGLHNLSVLAFVVDNSGDMWVATDGGVYRFDGSSFTLYDQRYGLPRDSTQALAVSPGGRIYARTDEGIFAGDTHQFEAILTTNGPVRSDLYTPLLAPSDRRLLYLRDHQLYQLDRPAAGRWEEKPLFTAAQLAAQPALRNLFGLLQGADGALWFGCGDGLCHQRDGQVEYWDANQGVPVGEYTALLQDPEGRLWARSATHVVVREPGARKFVVRDPPHPMIVSSRRLAMLGLDPQQRVITRTQTGLAILSDNQWREYGPENGIPDHAITQSVVDHEGNFWLGVQGTGIYRWSGYGNFESWTQHQGLDRDAVWTILRDRQHRLILGTDAGCRMLDEQAKRIVPCPWAGLPQEQTAASALDLDGNYWLAYQTEQLWMAPAGSTKAQRITSVPPHFNPSNLLFDRPGSGVMSAWSMGLASIDTHTLAVTFKRPPADARVDDIARAADGSLWLATNAGLYVLRDGLFTLVPTPLDGENIRPDTVTATPDGDVWASRVGSPILHVTGASTEHPHIEWIKPDSGVISVYSLRTDHRGWIWANSGNGVGVYNGHTWRRMGVEDGLIWSDTEQSAFYADDDGSVWVGTSGGLTHIKDPERWIRDTSRPVTLSISAAQFGNTDLLAAESPSLPWNANTALDVAFSARALERAPRTLLRYRLLGLSSEWAETESFSIHIPALAPGHYELEATAVDAAHDRSSATAHLAFDINPPWWQTRLFHVAEALAATAALMLLWRAMMQRQQRRHVQLENERREHERLLERATRDALTGLWNRATVLELLSGEIETARRSGTPLAVALADVDHFKLINDSLGHAGGDEILRQLTQRLRGSFRQRDLLGRYGGEEFLIVMPGVPEEDRGSLMESVRESMANLPFNFGGTELTVTISIGVAWMDPAGEPSADLIRRADHALYEAKAAGRNRVMYHLNGDSNPASLEATASRRYLQELLDRLRRESPPT